jgi:transposase
VVRQEILTGVERRRYWSTSDKQRIVTGAEAEGISVAELARRHDVTLQQIYQWRSELRSKGLLPGTPLKFVSVELAAEPGIRGPSADGVVAREHHIEIGLRNGRSLRVPSDMPDAVLHRMIRIAEAS